MLITVSSKLILVTRSLVWFDFYCHFIITHWQNFIPDSCRGQLTNIDCSEILNSSLSLSPSMLQFFKLRYTPSWPVCMKFKLMLGQRNMLVFAPIVRWLWKPFRLPSISIGTTGRKDAEWYIYPAHVGSVLGAGTWWGMRKQNFRQARERQFLSEVCRTWAVLGGSLGRT